MNSTGSLQMRSITGAVTRACVVLKPKQPPQLWRAYECRCENCPQGTVGGGGLRRACRLCMFLLVYFYSGDIPHFSELAELAPDSVATVPDRCSGTPIQVIPSASVGKNLRNALGAAEGLNDEILALQVSRNLFCNSQMRMLKRHLLEYKAAVQIRRRFTPEQLVADVCSL